MSALDLRAALHELAADVHPVDLVPAVARSAQRRARRRRVGAAALAVALVGAGSGAVQLNRGQHGADSVLGTGAANSSGTRSVVPPWLPAGVSLLNVINVDDSAATSAASVRAQPSRLATYRIDGAANRDTLPPGGLSAHSARDLSVHPATVIQSLFNPALTELPPSSADPAYFNVELVQIGQFTATLSTPKNGLGMHRLDWVDPQGYHTLSCDRIKTPAGTSGVGAGDLVRMARSLYS